MHGRWEQLHFIRLLTTDLFLEYVLDFMSACIIINIYETRVYVFPEANELN